MPFIGVLTDDEVKRLLPTPIIPCRNHDEPIDVFDSFFSMPNLDFIIV